MAKNIEARRMGARLLEDVVARAREKGKSNSLLTRMAYVGAGQIETITRAAAGLGFELVIQPPEEAETENWYAKGGKWKELLKTMVFHWWNREDDELIRSGNEHQLDLIYRKSEIRKKLYEAGLNADAFTEWLQIGKCPTIESFCILAIFEGFKVEWREIN